jgi:hypothetical protein
MSGRRRFWMILPAALAVGFALVLSSLSTQGTGATWTTTTTASTAAAGTGQWCAAPDPSEVGARFIRLSTVTTSVGTNEHMAIIPVANNAAWGGGTGSKTLGVRLWGCQTAPAGTLRVTAWSNPTPSVTDTWLAGSTTTVAPTSRLDPGSNLGAQLKGLSMAASVTATNTLLGLGGTSGDLRRYSWLISGGRTSAAPSTDPPQCNYSTLVPASPTCSVTITNSSGGDSTFASLFNILPWSGSTITANPYTARTWATETPTGWDAANAWLTNTNTGILQNGTVAAATTLTGTSSTDATLLGTTDGNQMQWVVIEWTGTVTPPSDLVLEVFLQ